MEGILVRLRRRDKRRLVKRLRKLKNAAMRTRYSIIVNLAEGRSVTDTAAALGVSRRTVGRVRNRFLEHGEGGLVDRREENGGAKLEECYLKTLYDVVSSSPHAYGWLRPTWTREMLVITIKKLIGVEIHVATMSRALKLIGARHGSPKPTVASTWSKQARNKRLREISQLLENLPADEVAVYEDEIDIHLNPKIGRDWMVPGQQKEVLTPGQNQKRYIAGALDARTGELTWVVGEKKNSLLFILLLWKLTQRYVQAKVIHVILDNYSIHRTQQVDLSLASEAGQQLRLHFLPPYCPDHNKIERTWQDLHANVTRNHHCRTIDELMHNIKRYLRSRTHKQKRQYHLAS
jgi:transposase